MKEPAGTASPRSRRGEIDRYGEEKKRSTNQKTGNEGGGNAGERIGRGGTGERARPRVAGRGEEFARGMDTY